MMLVKSLSVGEGDMFYIKHGNGTFTVIDCRLCDEWRDDVLAELKDAALGSEVCRFISTHPDDDHIRGLIALDDSGYTRNFYCVKNEAMKDGDDPDFARYCELRRDPSKVYYLEAGVKRAWLNSDSDGRSGAGISVLWPQPGNETYQGALTLAAEGGNCNNISPIVRYSVKDGPSFLWMGDMGREFMESILGDLSFDPVDVLFAPHHGRDSGRVPDEWLGQMEPKVVVIGEADSDDLCYYPGFNTIKQNSAGDIAFSCAAGWADVYVSKHGYGEDFLAMRRCGILPGMRYIGSIRADGCSRDEV